ncbi:alpha/beta fold hydrolase [Pseudoruegeria sp. HB172150]|uniref:alpha/beta fold hydrolase n=1 Tax=Pseudoruegeria sp. HB172150 TaxID=2721164 RepID=UPI0015543717|nr:alpha/beta hydrolase [Pseudoruegeria sp. HB172150]
MRESAPFFAEVSHGPEDVRTSWVTAEDGVRLRAAVWPGGTRGTVLMFNGRTEYVEKYGRTASELLALGFGMVSIDWRGQGLSDRALSDRLTGHVAAFSDYQLDVQAMLQAARAEGMAEPYYLIGHSMGGCIGLRALHEGLPVAAAAFSAPMWGIKISWYLRPVAWSLGWSSRNVGQGHRYAPGTGAASYLESAPFRDNMLTTDPGMWGYMQAQISGHPDLALGGPSLHWLHEALKETRALAQMPSPDVPCVTFLGSNERIVDVPAVHRRMQRWPNGRLEVLAGSEHEVLMETAATRAHVLEILRDTFVPRGAAR